MERDYNKLELILHNIPYYLKKLRLKLSIRRLERKLFIDDNTNKEE